MARTLADLLGMIEQHERELEKINALALSRRKLIEEIAVRAAHEMSRLPSDGIVTTDRYCYTLRRDTIVKSPRIDACAQLVDSRPEDRFVTDDDGLDANLEEMMRLPFPDAA